MDDLEVENTMASDFHQFHDEMRAELSAVDRRVSEFRDSFQCFRTLLVRCIIVGASTLIGNIGIFAWQASALWSQASSNEYRSKANELEIRTVATELVRQESVKSQLDELKIEIRRLNEGMTDLRDGLVELKTHKAAK